MKNIHVLPTDKPSRLYKSIFWDLKDKQKLKLTNVPIYKNSAFIKYNIYITNDEEIKEGDWVYYLHNSGLHKPSIHKVLKPNYSDYKPYSIHFTSGFGVQEDCKKIILTTDQELIKNGVQAIDDEFLEWFVKNPSCKRVEIFEQYRKCCRNTDGTNEDCIEPINCEGWLNSDYERPYKTNCDKRFEGYKIIIPKEEPKPFKQMEQLTEVDWGKFKKSPFPSKKEPKQEKLEEVKPKDIQRLISSTDAQTASIEIIGLFNKWQQEQERMYSEQDVHNILNNYNAFIGSGMKIPYFEWFEQFKKK